jgi:hypothetical protein
VFTKSSSERNILYFFSPLLPFFAAAQLYKSLGGDKRLNRLNNTLGQLERNLGWENDPNVRDLWRKYVRDTGSPQGGQPNADQRLAANRVLERSMWDIFADVERKVAQMHFLRLQRKQGEQKSASALKKMELIMHEVREKLTALDNINAQMDADSRPLNANLNADKVRIVTRISFFFSSISSPVFLSSCFYSPSTHTFCQVLKGEFPWNRRTRAYDQYLYRKWRKMDAEKKRFE